MQARILIVEDDQIIAADLRMKVEWLGHQVTGIATTGEEAIGLAGHSKPDLVLMDIQLEDGMTGTETARIIQESTGATIVFVTAFPGAALHDESVGMPEGEIYLGKPFSRIQLEAAVDAALAARARNPG